MDFEQKAAKLAKRKKKLLSLIDSVIGFLRASEQWRKIFVRLDQFPLEQSGRGEQRHISRRKEPLPLFPSLTSVDNEACLVQPCVDLMRRPWRS
jgi:hypothetical protein